MAISRRVLHSCAVFVVLGAQGALAGGGTGTITGMQGKVLLGNGKGFVHASLQQPVHPGDRLLVSDGAAATLAFDGCTLTLTPGAVHTVSARPCAAVETGAFNIIPANAPANTLDADLAQLELDQAQLHDLQKAVTRLRASAAADGDQVVQNCVDAKLFELKKIIRYVDTRMEVLTGNAPEDAAHQTKALNVAAQKGKAMAGDAAHCANNAPPDLRETTVTEMTEPSPLDTGLAAPPPPPPPPGFIASATLPGTVVTTGFVIGTGFVFGMEVLAENPVSVP